MHLTDRQIEQFEELAALLGYRRINKRYPPRGVLIDEHGSIFHWKLCPTHNVWLQPEHEPFFHWRCGSHKDCGVRCTYMRPAKMRNKIERSIMYSIKAIASLG